MKIATWNINGVKARLDGLVGWLRESNPDIACLQEIKSVDETFPRGEIEALGYHVETHGQKGFNGVALLSKVRPDEINRGLPGDPPTNSRASSKACSPSMAEPFGSAASICPTEIR